jgi:hypothetical protein
MPEKGKGPNRWQAAGPNEQPTMHTTLPETAVRLPRLEDLVFRGSEPNGTTYKITSRRALAWERLVTAAARAAEAPQSVERSRAYAHAAEVFEAGARSIPEHNEAARHVRLADRMLEASRAAEGAALRARAERSQLRPVSPLPVLPRGPGRAPRAVRRAPRRAVRVSAVASAGSGEGDGDPASSGRVSPPSAGGAAW